MSTTRSPFFFFSSRRRHTSSTRDWSSDVCSSDLDGVTRDYYVRQFHDWKGGADVDRLLVPGATVYAQICGATLARAHARWGDRIAIASYLGRGDAFDRAVADFSYRYADQNERDYDAFKAAVSSGRLTARAGL